MEKPMKPSNVASMIAFVSWFVALPVLLWRGHLLIGLTLFATQVIALLFTIRRNQALVASAKEYSDAADERCVAMDRRSAALNDKSSALDELSIQLDAAQETLNVGTRKFIKVLEVLMNPRTRSRAAARELTNTDADPVAVILSHFDGLDEMVTTLAKAQVALEKNDDRFSWEVREEIEKHLKEWRREEHD